MMTGALARRSFIQQAAMTAVMAGLAVAGHPLGGGAHGDPSTQPKDAPTDAPTKAPDKPPAAPPDQAQGTPAPGQPPADAAAPAVSTPLLQIGDHGDAVKALQGQLLALGYWVAGTAGTFGSTTQSAVFALQKVTGLDRDGVCGPATWARLQAGARPTASTSSGHVIEVHKDRQILLVVDSGKVSTILSTCTGAGRPFVSKGVHYDGRTPSGDFHVYFSKSGWDHGPLGDLYRPMFFNGGIAIHGAGAVPPYPASHGCCRVTVAAMDMLLATGSVAMGNRVVVY